MRFALVVLTLIALFVVAARWPGHAGAAATPFQWRGVIQGQYGPQFRPAERRRLLRFMARNGFNAYVHAPKGDPYQRTLWRDPYPPDQQATFDDEVRLATRLGVEWIPNVSPAAPAYPSPGDAPPPGTTPSAPICFSSAADLDQLVAKLQPFLDAGSRAVMVSFDDVQLNFSCNGDVAAYGTGAAAYGHANADLLDRLYARLQAHAPPIRLLTVTPDYFGTADTAYLQGLRAALAPGIEVLWTGPSIQSRQFAAGDADAYAQLIGRAPIVWENWTADDLLTLPGANPPRIFLGPYSRAANLVGHVRGFFFNPANQSDLNPLPLATAGSWMRRPARYRPREAFLRETRALGGPEAAALRAFAEASYSTTLRPGIEAPTLTRLMRRLLVASKGVASFEPGAGGSGSKRTAGRRRLKQAAALRRAERAGEALRSELRLAMTARWHLRRVARLRTFVRQARPYLHSVRLNARAGLLATDLLEARRAGVRRDLGHRLRAALRRARRFPVQTYGTRTGIYGLAGNVIDGYVARVRARDRQRTRPSRQRARG